jgi:acyl-CoA synthetase (AMP-forming)/AMP-acid ligase II
MLMTQGVLRSIAINPEATATLCKGRRRTFRELGERIQRVAGGLQDLGLQRGDRVAIWALNSDRYLESLLAVFWAGGVVVPVNYRWSSAEVLFSLDDAEVSILLVDEQFRSAAEEMKADAKTLQQLVYIGDSATPQGMSGYEDMLEAATPVAATNVDPTDMAGIFYTGGTTGFPKGVMLSHLNLWSSAMSVAMDGWCSTPDTVYFHVAPMFHLADLAATGAALIYGASHSFLDVFDPAAIFERIEQEQVTETLIVPTMIPMLLDHPEFKHAQLGSLRQISYGASPMSEGLLARTMLSMPDVKFTQGYGMTELSPVCCVLKPEYHTSEGLKLGKLRSAGRPTYIVEVRIVDEDDNEVSRGTVGEIVARGPNVMMGYWKRPEETAHALRNGWMHTGDGGYMDEDGFVFLVDRLKDMIISGGENVYCGEVEGALSKHPAVGQPAVIGIPDKKWGETVHAFIILKPGCTATQEEIIAHCHELIAGYKCPRSVAFVDALPLSGAGKIQKNVLREPFWKDCGRGIH